MPVQPRPRSEPPDQQGKEHRRGKRVAPEGDQAFHNGRTVNSTDMAGTVAKLYKEMLNASENGGFSP